MCSSDLCGLSFVTDQVKAGESGVNIETCNAHGVVVVPERRCGLIIVIHVIATDTWHVPVFGKSIMFGARVSAVEMSNGANCGIGNIQCVIECAVNSGVDGEQMLRGQVIDETDATGCS